MLTDLQQRALDIGKYITDTKCTVRKAAVVFNISKSTVHSDVSKKLPKIDAALSAKVHAVLEINYQEKHIRGGEATKNKYAHM